MLAPFVLDLLMACSLLLLAGWANQFLTRGKRVGSISNSAIASHRPERRLTCDRAVFFVCSPCAANGKWLFTLEDQEQN